MLLFGEHYLTDRRPKRRWLAHVSRRPVVRPTELGAYKTRYAGYYGPRKPKSRNYCTFFRRFVKARVSSSSVEGRRRQAFSAGRACCRAVRVSDPARDGGGARLLRAHARLMYVAWRRCRYALGRAWRRCAHKEAYCQSPAEVTRNSSPICM